MRQRGKYAIPDFGIPHMNLMIIGRRGDASAILTESQLLHGTFVSAQGDERRTFLGQPRDSLQMGGKVRGIRGPLLEGAGRPKQGHRRVARRGSAIRIAPKQLHVGIGFDSRSPGGVTFRFLF
jgi:hypothetical protein